MTEKEAWLSLAKTWSERLTKCTCGCGLLVVKDGSTGLCSSLDGLLDVTEEVQFKMRKIINKLPNIDDDSFSNYKWTGDRKGAAQRVAFCKKMAKACGKKRRSPKQKARA